jgi:hypothetical protein
MNERIKQLWEDSDAIEVCYPEQGSPVSVSANTLEKFAELIVRDCMEVASPNYMSTPEDSVYYVEQAIDRIAEHFGVEE